MPAPQRVPRTHPGRSLAFVLVVLIGLYAGLFFGKGGHARTPELGIDLQGGTSVTLTAHPIGNNGKLTKSQLDEAVNIIRNRVNGAGVGGASVDTQGSNQIVVTVPGKNNGNLVDIVSRQALLSFRLVLGCDNSGVCPSSTLPTPPGSPLSQLTPTTPTTSSSPAPAQSGSAAPLTSTSAPATGNARASSSAASTSKASSKSTAKRKRSTQGDVVLPGLSAKHRRSTGSRASSTPAESGSATPTAAASGSATPGGSASPSAGATTPAATPSSAPVKQLPGALLVADPSCPASKPKCVVKRGNVVVASPNLAEVQASYGKLDCRAVDNNPTDGNDIPPDYMLACDTTGFLYLLAPSEVTKSWPTGGVQGTDVKSASSGLDSQSAQWTVNLTLKGSGGSKYQTLTAAAAQDDHPSGGSASPGCKSSGLGCNAVAIVLDGQVQSAPYTSPADGIPGGQAQISGSFNQKSAAQLANVLSYGSLPLKTDPGQAETVSPTLGSSQLRGGLIAGVISLVLVAVFSLVYYRALGIVTILSLILSGLILYSITTMLGHSRLGYTLSLAGIAGFIVAVGITADSFVVFFERLRDEVREGRRLRSGVERAWPRARRTIISADAVSLLAAVILYIVSISDVRGFAFTLGLSTLSDLFIVFFFTKPLITLLSRRPAFDRGAAWTGVGKNRGRRTYRSSPATAPRGPAVPGDDDPYGEPTTAATKED